MTATLPDQDNAIFERLLRGSAKQSYDPEVDVDWDAPLVDGKWGITPERISIYGTELWDSLTLEQQSICPTSTNLNLYLPHVA